MPQQLPLYCVPTIALVVGAVILVVMMTRPYVLREIVDADALDPAQQPKEEWREKALNMRARRNRFYLLAYAVLFVLVWIGMGVYQYGPRVVTALRPSATVTPTAAPSNTPQPTRTRSVIIITRTRDPNETITPMGPSGTRRSPTPRPASTTPAVQTIYQQVVQTRIVYQQVTVQVYITVVVTATDTPLSTGTATDTDTPLSTGTATDTDTPLSTGTPTTPIPATSTITETPTATQETE